MAATAPGRLAAGPVGEVEVVAVLVVHDGATWLPRVLGALASSDRRPDRVVAVDAGSTDRSPLLLDTAARPVGGTVIDAVVRGDVTDGLGTSVARGIAQADGLQADAPDDDRETCDRKDRAVRERWVWLLHDDCAPAPNALDQLLAAVAASPTIAVAGCKQRGWDDPRTLVEIGVTMSHGGRRIDDVTEGELDQGQHDDRGDVLAVSTAGMLVRRDVWDDIGGLDPALPLVGDDIDLCLRVRRAGHRVAVVPSAVVRHVGALSAGRRVPDGLRSGVARRVLGRPDVGDLVATRRRRALQLRLVHCHPLLLLPLLAWVLLGAPVHAAAWLVRRRPRIAWAELTAVLFVASTPWQLLASRRRARRGRVTGASAVRPMLRSRRQVLREDLDAVRARRGNRRHSRRTPGDRRVSDDRRGPGDRRGSGERLGSEDRRSRGDRRLGATAWSPDARVGASTSLLGGPESGPVDEASVGMLLSAPRPLRRLVAHPLSYLLPAALVLGALLRTAGREAGGYPGPWAVDGLGARELVLRAGSGWRDVGAGVAAVADPAVWVWAGLTAVVSTVTAGTPAGASLGAAHDLVVLLAPAVALLVAYPTLRRVAASRAAAASLATTWALLPWTGLLGPVTPSTLLVHALLPALAASLLGCLGPRSVSRSGMTALLTCVVVALVPPLWPVVVVAAVVVGVVAGASSSASVRAALPVLAVSAPLLVWGPWAAAALRDPRLLLLDPAAADPSSPVLGTVVREPGTVLPLVGVLVAALLLLVGTAVSVALPRRQRPAALATAAVALAAAATGWAAAAVQVDVTGRSGAGPWSALWLAVLVCVALVVRSVVPRAGGPAGSVVRASGSRRVRLWGLAAVGVLVPAVLLATVAAAPSLGREEEPRRGLPPAAAVEAASAQQSRTLVLEATPASGTDGAASGAAGPEAATGAPLVSWSMSRGEPGLGQDSTAALLQRGGDPGAAAGSGGSRLEALVTGLLGRAEDTDGSSDEALAADVTDDDVVATDIVEELVAAGVGWVVLDIARAEDAALRADVEDALATRPGLVATSSSAVRTVWRVDPGPDSVAPARARVVDPGGTRAEPVDLRTDVQLPEGAPGRRLVLAEAEQAGWTATVDRVPLVPSTVGGWRQGFLLPAGAGALQVTEPGPGSVAYGVGAAAVLLLLVAASWPWRGGRPMVLRSRTPPVASGARWRRWTGSLSRAALGAAVAVALGVGALGAGVAGGAGGAPGGPGAFDGVDAFDGVTGPSGSAALPVQTSVVLDSPARQVACPGPIASLVPEGGSGPSADPGRTQVTGPQEMAALDLEDAGVASDNRRGLQLTVATSGDLRGAVLTGCARAAVTSWVLLSGTTVGERPVVVLDNPADTTAVVDIRVLTGSGPVAAPAGSGYLVPAGQRVAVPVDALVPDAQAVLVEVTARQGSVAVTGADTALQGLVPQGRAELAAVTEAASQVLVPVVEIAGDPSGGAGANLRLGSVGDEPGVATVTVLGPDGPLELGDAGVVVLPGSTVVDVPLRLPAGAHAVRVSADVPLVAAVRTVAARGGELTEGLTGVPAERSWVAGEPVDNGWRDDFAVAWPDVPGVAGRVGLVLHDSGTPAPDGEATEVLVVDGTGSTVATTEVLLAQDRAVTLDLSALLPPDSDLVPAAVVVRPGGAARVHAGLTVVVPDPDGDLRAATAVVGPSTAADTVLLRAR